MSQTPANLLYGVEDRPPLHQTILLGLQYALLNSIYLILVVIVFRAAGASPEVSRSAVSLGMIAVAATTILQALPRGPIGSGYMAPPVYSAIYLGPCVLAAKEGGLPAVFAMTVFAGLVEIVLSRFLHRLRIIMQPAITGLIVCVVGLQLGLVGMQQALDVADTDHATLAPHMLAAAATIAVAIGLSIWGTGVWRLLGSLAGLLVGASAGLALGIFKPGLLSRLAETPMLALPHFDYISFEFMPSLLPAFAAAAVAATLRTVGVVTTCQRANDVNWQAPDFGNLRKGTLADGIGCTIAGLLGTMGLNIAPSLVGVSIATGVTSRVVAYACAAALVVLAFVPKVSAAFLELPMSIAGALLVFTAAIMVTSGLQLMNSRFLDNRTVFVIGLGILVALVSTVNRPFFESLPSEIRIITDSSLSLSLVVAIGLTLIFRVKRHTRERLGWKQPDEMVEDLRALFRRRGPDWKLEEKTVQRCLTNVRHAIRLLDEGHNVREPLSIAAIREETGLTIEMSYKGIPITIPDINSARTETTEESSATAGMSYVCVGVFPDRSTTAIDGDAVSLRLTFNG